MLQNASTANSSQHSSAHEGIMRLSDALSNSESRPIRPNIARNSGFTAAVTLKLLGAQHCLYNAPRHETAVSDDHGWFHIVISFPFQMVLRPINAHKFEILTCIPMGPLLLHIVHVQWNLPSHNQM